MNSRLKPAIGALLVLVALLSLALSALGVAQTWRLKAPFLRGTLTALDLFDSTLQATTGAIQLAGDSLLDASDSADTLQSTIGTLAQSLEESAPLLDSLISLVEADFPQTISSAQVSLDAAQTSARLIDSVLRALTIFNRDLYNPPVPLHIALGQVSSSLEGLPDSFSAMQGSLVATQGNLNLIQGQVEQVSRDISGISSNLEGAQEVIEQYQEVLSKVGPEVQLLKTRVPVWVDWLVWLITFTFVWLGVAQAGMFFQGWQMVRSGQVAPKEETA